ncbi:PTS sugar transporter subunit IIA [Sodalis sp. RH21]|uniref:PTS sugar transporter subunit IIA n=1 Tax=unclassified Sodalis (in: enterobacteria) TaxID=2636512 RepID=UPI0039B62027
MNSAETRPWILIITHGLFGEELVKSCEMVLGKMEQVYCFSLLVGMPPEQLIEDVNKVLEQAPVNSIIFTDIYAGTPSNVGAVFSKKIKCPVICGVNLPMLIEAEMSRSEVEGEALAEKILEAGNQSIKNITKIANKR